MNKKGGRPLTSDSELESIVSKLAPHLQRGQTLRTACIKEKISHATVYRKYDDVEWFRDRIDSYSNHKKILYGDIRLAQLEQIHTEIEKAKKNNKKIHLDKTDTQFLNWLGENDRTLSEAYGKKEVAKKEEDEKEKQKRIMFQDPRVLKSLLQLKEIYYKKMNSKNLIDKDIT